MTMPKPSFSICLDGTSAAVRAALSQVRDRLEEHNEAEDILSRLEIVLAEILNNIVEHAFAGMQGGRITLECSHDGQDWILHISDNGARMPAGEIPGGRFPTLETAFDDLPEGGFGWAMVHLLTRDIVYSRHAGGNRLRLRLPARSEAG